MRFFIRVFAIALTVLFVFGTPVHAGPALDKALNGMPGTDSYCRRATCTIWINPGGEVEVFQEAAKEVLAEGWRLVIDGFCASACVILADLARENTCITVDAQMALHKESLIRVTGTRIIAGKEVNVGKLIRRQDPPDSDDINTWVYAHGGYPSDGLLVMPFKDARKFWAPC